VSSSLSFRWAGASSDHLVVHGHSYLLLDFNFHVFIDWHSICYLDKGWGAVILILSLGSCVDLELGKVSEDLAHCGAGENKVPDQSAVEQLGANTERA
jgi:hypothetical protein